MILGQSKKRPSIEDINNKIPSDSFLKAVKHLGVKPLPIVRRAITLFVCKCGREIEWYSLYVIQGRKKSCGCLVGNGYRRNAKYSYCSNKLRRVYYSMIARCHIKTDSRYKWYGAIGVVVCKEWRDNPQSFFDWAASNDYKEGLHIDKDKLGNGLLYSPETCCWITQDENAKYKKDSQPVIFNGERLSAAQFIKQTGCGKDFSRTRIRKGLSGEEIVKEFREFVDAGRPHWKTIKSLTNFGRTN